MSTPPTAPQCEASSYTVAGHVCHCRRNQGHTEDVNEVGPEWHVCVCGTRWTAEKEVNLAGDSKVVQLFRIPTDVAYSGEERPVNDVSESGCPVCGNGDGPLITAALGQFVHPDCQTSWVYAATAAQTMLRRVLTILAYDASADYTAGPRELAATKYIARLICTLARTNVVNRQ